MGCRGPFRRLAGVAVSAGRAASHLANGLCLVRLGSAPVGDPVAGGDESTSSAAPRLPALLPLRLSVVHGQLLLGPRHDVPLRRHAGNGSDAAAGGVQPGAGALLWPFWPVRGAGAPDDRQHSPGLGRRAHLVDRAGTSRLAHHFGAVGSVGLLAGGQRLGEPACALDRRLRHQLFAGCGQCAHYRRAGAEPEFRTAAVGHCRSGLTRRFRRRRDDETAQACRYSRRRSGPAESGRGR